MSKVKKFNMKNLLNFVVWKWNKWELWQKCFIGSSVFFGAALVAEPPYNVYLSSVPMCVILGFSLKWFIWDSTIKTWKDYQAEKTELFSKIKDSEKS